MFTLLIVGCGVLGLVIGSFLNVVIYRVPRHQSVASPPSACPKCDTAITARDNIPVVSWLLLRGRCRQCDEPIASRYPLVELLTSGLFIGVGLRFPFNWSIPAYLFFVAGLVALSWIDVEHLVLPKGLVYVHLAIVLSLFVGAAAVTDQWSHLIIALVCSASWWCIFFLLNLINPQWLGFGDVRFSLVLGLALGWLGFADVVLGFFASNFVGAIVGIILIGSGKIERSRRIPYGIFLSIGSMSVLYFGNFILRPLNLA